MGSLDDKLKRVLQDWYPGTQYEEVMPLLKQAFADEGYAQATHIVMDDKQLERLTGKMTGQEWYDRFEAELATVNRVSGQGLSVDSVEDAAKRAAGL